MGWQLESAKVKKVTTALAQSISEMEPAPGDRPRSERRLQVHERAIRSGTFRPCVWATAYCKENGLTYRVNGKHTSELFSTLAKEFPEHYVIHEIYVCDTVEDIGRLYGTFDSAATLRKADEIYLAFAATIPELKELPKKIISVCPPGIAGFKDGGLFSGAGKSSTASERAELLLEHPDFVMWTYKVIEDTHKNRHLCRAGVIAAMFASWQRWKREAEVFWSAVRDETGEKPTCPDRVLAKWLIMTSVSSKSDRPKERRVDSRHMYFACVEKWNNWRKGEPAKLIKYYPDKKVPVAI